MSEPLTEERAWAFLDQLAETSNVSLSADRTGVSRSAVYRLRATSQEFRDGWAMAVGTNYEELELNMLKRARFGVLKPFKRPDGTLGRITEYDDALGLKLLMAYKARAEQDQGGKSVDAGLARAARDRLETALTDLRRRVEAMAGATGPADQDAASLQ